MSYEKQMGSEITVTAYKYVKLASSSNMFDLFFNDMVQLKNGIYDRKSVQGSCVCRYWQLKFASSSKKNSPDHNAHQLHVS